MSHRKRRKTTQTPSLLDFDEFDESCVRLWKIFREAIEPLFSNILGWVTPGCIRITDLKDHLINKGVGIIQIKKSLNKRQLKKLMNLSPEDKLDVTYIYALLQLSGVLAGKQDEKWSEEKGSDPELSITCLKKLRNDIAHEISIDKERCSRIIKATFEHTRNIRESLKHAVLRDVLGSERKKESEKIDKVFDNTLQKIDEIGKGTIGIEAFDEFPRELEFSRKKRIVGEEGLPNLRKYLAKSETFSPFHHIIRTSSNLKISVAKIFTEMKLEGEKDTCIVPIEDILNHVHHDDPSLLLINGLAGMGKTTLVKKIISDWLSKKGDIKGLNDFGLLLHVECRDYIESFKDLLVMSLGDVHQKFKDNELTHVCLAFKCLLIIDGFDELNEKSSKFFQDILTLKKFHNLSVIVTTRPEFVEKFNCQVKSDYTTVSTIHLEGIPKEMIEEFVNKYYTELKSESSPSQSLNDLLQYLKKTMHIMLEVWALPLNLVVVTILWMNKPKVINSITTEAELFWQIYHLSVSKLDERLENNKLTKHIPTSMLKTRRRRFIEKLGLESLKALKEDVINIPESTIKDLDYFCESIGLPAEELTGAFLKKVTTSRDSTRYSFPHKGTMEFMGAYYIFKKVTHQTWADTSMATDILPESEPKDMATVTNIFRKLHDGCLPETLHKYQNMLIQLISLFHVAVKENKKKVSKETMIEALRFLEQSGVSNKYIMLRIMKNLKCDDWSTKLIAQMFKLFDKKTVINESTCDAYIALLKAIEPPLRYRDEIDIHIDLHDTPSGFNDLPGLLLRHQLYPRTLIIRNHLSGFSSPNAAQTESIKNLLSKDCDKYRGIWSRELQEMIPQYIRVMKVRLQDQPSLNALCESLEKTKAIRKLAIRFSVNDISRDRCRPIPFLERGPIVNVYVTDVKEEDIEKVGDILRTLQPQDTTRSFNAIGFPRCSLRSQEEFVRLLDSLKGVRVMNDIRFPVDVRPDDEASVEEMHLEARESTGCKLGIQWMELF